MRDKTHVHHESCLQLRMFSRLQNAKPELWTKAQADYIIRTLCLCLNIVHVSAVVSAIMMHYLIAISAPKKRCCELWVHSCYPLILNTLFITYIIHSNKEKTQMRQQFTEADFLWRQWGQFSNTTKVIALTTMATTKTDKLLWCHCRCCCCCDATTMKSYRQNKKKK